MLRTQKIPFIQSRRRAAGIIDDRFDYGDRHYIPFSPSGRDGWTGAAATCFIPWLGALIELLSAAQGMKLISNALASGFNDV